MCFDNEIQVCRAYFSNCIDFVEYITLRWLIRKDMSHAFDI